MGSAFAKAVNDLDEESFQALYGRWDPLEPAQVAELFRASSVRWWIAGGRAARIGAPARHHEDTDVAVSLEDIDELRKDLADWHLWEANTPSTASPICGLRSYCCTRPISTGPRTGRTWPRPVSTPAPGPGWRTR
jgi:hypothetical protein